jgi:hypothetical protein
VISGWDNFKYVTALYRNLKSIMDHFKYKEFTKKVKELLFKCLNNANLTYSFFTHTHQQMDALYVKSQIIHLHKPYCMFQG